MTKCEDGHRQIIYDETERDENGVLGVCPLCDAEEKIANLKRTQADWAIRLGYRSTK